MDRRVGVLWLFLVLAGLVFAGPVFARRMTFAPPLVYPRFVSPVSGVSGLVSPKWKLKDSVSGDLNGDGLRDLVVVLEYTDKVKEKRPDSIDITGHPRILLVLFRDSVHSNYRVAVQNNTFLLRDGEGGPDGDPYGGLSVTNGLLVLEFQFARTLLTYKFRYQDGGFHLTGATTAGTVEEQYESWDYNFLTGWAKHESHDDSKENEPVHEEWKQYPLSAPVLLQEMKKPFMLEISQGVFI